MTEIRQLFADSRLTKNAKLIVVLSGFLLVITVPFAMVPALPAMAHYFGKGGDGALVAQLVLALPSLAMLVGAPLGGWAADFIGVRRCLLGSLAVFVVAGGCGLIAPSLAVLIASRLFLGFAAGVASTLCTVLTAEWYEPGQRSRILGYAHAVSSIYNILILLAGGWLVDKVGWRAPSAFYLLSVIVLVAAWHVAKDRPPVEIRK
jgi:MFS family permease